MTDLERQLFEALTRALKVLHSHSVSKASVAAEMRAAIAAFHEKEEPAE